MGDKSPKSKERKKQQASADRQQKSVVAKAKEPVSAVRGATKK